jgi:hypothetical protein
LLRHRLLRHRLLRHRLLRHRLLRHRLLHTLLGSLYRLGARSGLSLLISWLSAKHSACQAVDCTADSLSSLLAASQSADRLADRLAEATLPWLAAQGSACEATNGLTQATLAALLRNGLLRGLNWLLGLSRSRLRDRLLRLRRLRWLCRLLHLIRWDALSVLVVLRETLICHWFLFLSAVESATVILGRRRSSCGTARCRRSPSSDIRVKRCGYARARWRLASSMPSAGEVPACSER